MAYIKTEVIINCMLGKVGNTKSLQNTLLPIKVCVVLLKLIGKNHCKSFKELGALQIVTGKEDAYTSHCHGPFLRTSLVLSPFQSH